LSMSHGSEFIVGLNNAVYTPVSKIKIMDDVFRFIEKNPCVFKGYSIHQIPQSQIESRQFQDYIKNSDCTQEEVLQVYKLKEN